MNDQIELRDGADRFAVSVFPASSPRKTALFAVGAGGNPHRHAGLLNALASQGCNVVAPHFERMTSHMAGADELAQRSHRLRLALDYAAGMKQPLVAAGHSIGAAMLIGLAGGRIFLRNGQRLHCEMDERIKRMAVFAPAMDFFPTPGALDAVGIPIQVWGAALDTITPLSQAMFLKDALGPLADLRLIEGAGHFSFMNELPPQVVDPLAEREAFLLRLSSEVGKFLLIPEG